MAFRVSATCFTIGGGSSIGCLTGCAKFTGYIIGINTIFKGGFIMFTGTIIFMGALIAQTFREIKNQEKEDEKKK
jgi:hypothetical protein